MQREIAAIVVTYNRKALLAQCICALQAQTFQGFDTIIIDNASTDGTYEAIAGQVDGDRVRYHNLGTNTGGAGGFHHGLAYAMRAGYRYFWLMDDDCQPTPGALQALRDAGNALGGAYGFLSSVVLWTDGTPCQMNIQKTSLRGKIAFPEDIGDMPRTTPVQFATFVSFFVTREVVLEMGLPIAEFFIWADDLEYSRRISRKYPGYVVGDSIAIHACELNRAGAIERDVPERFDRYRCMYRNEVYLYRREGAKGFLYMAMRVGLHLARVVVKGQAPRRTRVWVILSGVWAGRGFAPEVGGVTGKQGS